MGNGKKKETKKEEEGGDEVQVAYVVRIYGLILLITLALAVADLVMQVEAVEGFWMVGVAYIPALLFVWWRNGGLVL